MISGIKVGGMTKASAVTLLRQYVRPPEKISIIAKNRSFELSLKDVNSYNLEQTVETAFYFYRTGNLIKDNYDRAISPFSIQNIPVKTNINEEALDQYLQVISTQVSTEPKFPSVSIKENEVLVDKGSAGEDIDTVFFKKTLKHDLRRLITHQLNFLSTKMTRASARKKQRSLKRELRNSSVKTSLSFTNTKHS